MKSCIWIGACTLLAASCVSGIVFGVYEPDIEIARLNRQIDIDLPIGTSRAEVKKWLTARPDFDLLDEFDIDGSRGIRAEAGRAYFWYWSGDLRIMFYFNEQNRLAKHHIEFEECPL